MMRVHSSDPNVEKNFAWALAMASNYVVSSASVGPWYEAALPGRQAFCIRDVAHQSTGAQVMGLAAYTKNMIVRFAENIAESRRWCTYWEITHNNLPASVDYQNDEHFWYNLPSNFDLMDCCRRQYEWTGDRDYLINSALRTFFEKSTHEYIAAWDRDGDGIPEHYPSDGRCGIASYNEDARDPLMGGDMVAAEYAGFRAASQFALWTKDSEAAAECLAAAEHLRQTYNHDWWNTATETFYGLRNAQGEWSNEYAYIANFLPLYFDIVDPGRKTDAAIAQLVHHGSRNVEDMTYLVDLLYQYGRSEEAYTLWNALPQNKRSAYPEVSFCMVGAIVAGMAGIEPTFSSRTVDTRSRLTTRSHWLELVDVPLFDGTIDVKHVDTSETQLVNQTSLTLNWRAIFPGMVDQVRVDGEPISPQTRETKFSGAPESFVMVAVGPGSARTVRMP